MTRTSGATRHPLGRPIVNVAVVLSLAFGALAGAAGYWGVVRGPELARAPSDAAVIAASRTVPRGRILDRDGKVLAKNATDANGELYRVYANDAISPVVGYASRRYGRAGLEKSYDAELAGLSSDSATDVLRKFMSDPYDPQDLTLSLSLDLQRAAVRALGSNKGAVVMLDPADRRGAGARLDADLRRVGRGGPSDSRVDLRRAPPRPGAAASPEGDAGPLRAGLRLQDRDRRGRAGVRGRQAVDDVQAAARPPRRPACWSTGSASRTATTRRPDPGRWTSSARPRSRATSGMRLTGLKTGGANLVTYADRMGFDGPIPFDLPTAVSQLNDGSGREPGGFADDVELANAAYGQAETFVTPLQMALVASTVANDGVLMQPRLVTAMTGERSGTRQIGPSRMATVIDAADANAITDGMVAAVEGDLGRQFTTGAKVPGVTTAGKSGTAELGGTGEPHSWFIGFAPADHPTVAIAVLVEQGGRGAEAAAPIAGALMTRYLQAGR